MMQRNRATVARFRAGANGRTLVYKLTLTDEERTALVWIGYRYSHGADLLFLLNKCELPVQEGSGVQDYEIPEHLAWEMQEKINQDDLACINPRSDLYRKLRSFADNIV